MARPRVPAVVHVADHSPSSGAEADGWTARLARHRTGLAALSLAESTVVPVPLEAIIVPLMIGHPKRAMAISVIIWLACLVGASLFYVLGLWLADPVVLPVLDWLGLREDFDRTAQDLDEDGLFWTVFLISFLPAPMQLATLGAGVAGGNYLVFLAAIALSRGLRYFGLAILAQFLGERLQKLDLPTGRIVIALAAIMVAVWAVSQFL